MKNKLQILGVAIATIFAIWLVVALLSFTIQIVMTKIFLLALIVGSFIVFRNNRDGFAKYILIASMLLGVFIYDMIINILFMLIVILMMQIVKRINVKQLGPIQITLLVFAAVYLVVFGIALTLAKLIAVFAVMSLFMLIIWKEISIYFQPTLNSANDEIDFVDQNINHRANKLKEHLGKFMNVELMTKDIALNLSFTIYILLVAIQMISELIYMILPGTV